jgi:fermentation-respiration switch protein FrsA (DUF1100 family)
MSESIIELRAPDGTRDQAARKWQRRNPAAYPRLDPRPAILRCARQHWLSVFASSALIAAALASQARHRIWARKPATSTPSLTHLNVDSLHLLGVSQGARVALRYAAQRPQRVRSLILQGPAVDGYVPPMEDSSGIPLADYMALAARGELDELRQRWLAHPLMNSETLSSAQSASLQEMVNAYRGSDLLAGTPAASAIPDLLERLGSLDLPTLLITGERETAARQAHCARLAEVMRDVREVVLPDCGHLSNYSQPQAYNRAVDEFVGSLTARGRRP